MTRRRAVVAAAVPAAMALLAACGGDARPDAVSDAAAAWHLDSMPLVTAGGEGAAEEFGDVVGVAILSDGGFVVGDGQAQQLRVYDRDGRLRRTVGRSGGGPGEFRQLRWAGALPGDTLVGFDRRGWRFTLFTRDGERARTVDLVRAPFLRSPQPIAVLADGSVLLVGRAMPPAPDGPVRGGVAVESTTVARVRLTTGEADSIATLPMQRTYRGDRGWFASVMSFTPRLALVATPGGFAAGYGDDTVVSVFALDGRRRVVPAPLPHQPIPDDVARAERDRRIERSRDFRPQVEAMWREIDLPDRYPRFDAIAADGAGRIWIRAHPAADAEPGRWTVFDSAGRVVAHATLPPRFDVVEIRGDRVLGRWRDADDVEYVGVFALRRP